MKTTDKSSLALKLATLAGATGVAPHLHADIVNISNVPFASSNYFNVYGPWDIDTGVSPFSITQHTFRASSGIFLWGSAAISADPSKNQGFGLRSNAPGQLNLTLGLKVGATINKFSTNIHPVTTLLNLSYNPARPFQNGTNNYIGFQFTNSNSGLLDYGWAQLNIQPGAASSFTIIDGAYDNSGAAIEVGAHASGAAIEVGADPAVPEPSSIALLALGATGLAAWRLRRKKAASA